MNKKDVALIVGFLIIGIGLGIVGVKYSTEWNEPEATYVETSEPKLIQVREDMTKLKAELKARQDSRS